MADRAAFNPERVSGLPFDAVCDVLTMMQWLVGTLVWGPPWPMDADETFTWSRHPKSMFIERAWR